MNEIPIEFCLTGKFEISKHLKPIYDKSNGQVCGYELPDGRKAYLCVALEIESVDGTDYEYVTNETAMVDDGFTNLDYIDSFFEDPRF
jgi:hypothetical protein